MTVAVLIVAAGKGERAGSVLPKQFAVLGGKALVAHAVDAFASHRAVDEIFVVIAPGQQALLQTAFEGRHVAGVIEGGALRQDSVLAGLSAITADHVLIHDAARPFVPHDVIDRLLQALETDPAAVPALPSVDTLATADSHLGGTIDRSTVFRIQTPQAFHLDAIMSAHQRWSGEIATDDAQMARAAGFEVALVEGSSLLDKLTYPADFTAAQSRFESRMVSRTGMGFDVHRLEAGSPLWLGGVLIPHDKGLAGHSDADVALHAIVDALLGAICAGDIGSHFPPSDPQWKGAESFRFVEYARDLVIAAGGIIDHIDLTLICEAPRIGAYREDIRSRIAELVCVDRRWISVKATTTERLGFTGRGEGIAAQAVATVRS